MMARAARFALGLFNPVRWLDYVRTNPVILKEMRSRMRGWRAVAAITSFLVMIGATVGMIYIGFAEAGTVVQGVSVRRTIGETIFYTIFMFQLFIVGISSPGMTSAAIAAEREHQTYDLLRTTQLSARSLVIGKLVASVAFVLLLLLASLPIQSVGFIFGGVSIGEIFIAVLVLVLTALNFGAVGLFFSSFIRRARIATVLAQTVTLTFSIALPILTLVGISIFSALWFTGSSPLPEWIFAVIGWFVVIGSPVATAIATELILIEEQTFFFFQATANGINVWVPSPWLGFTFLYLALTLVYLALTIRVVKQPDAE